VIVVRPATDADVERMVGLYAEVADEGRWLGGEAPVDQEELRARWRHRLAEGEGVHLVAETAGVAEAEMGGVAEAEVERVAAAAVGGLVVGHASIEVAAYRVAYLGMLVDRSWRGRGVGTALVEAVVEAARAEGCHKVALQVWPHNEAARALYRKVGFEEEGILRRHYRRRNGELWDAVVMGLVLDRTSPGSSADATGG
jgi:RimJ/RimL family protein N-acetyltransferase